LFNRPEQSPTSSPLTGTVRCISLEPKLRGALR
jgi:hypothetical protein